MKVSQRLRQREQAASTRRVWQHTTAVKARKTHGAYPDGGCGVFNHRSKPMADEQGSAEGRRQTHSVHTRVRHARRNVTTATRRSEGAIRRDDDASSQRKPLEGPHQLGNDPPPDEAIHRGAVLFLGACLCPCRSVPGRVGLADGIGRADMGMRLCSDTGSHRGLRPTHRPR